MIALFLESPFGSGTNRSASSPPSPVLLLPPMRFMAIASVSCASLLIAQNDMAPVVNRLTMSFAGSTSSSGIGCGSVFSSSSPRMFERRLLSSLTSAENSLNVRKLLLLVACCSL